jgi:hypothetical protein
VCARAGRFIIESVFQSLQSLGYILLLGAVIFVIFGIVSLSLFMGRFASCNDEDAAGMNDCMGQLQVSIKR